MSPPFSPLLPSGELGREKERVTLADTAGQNTISGTSMATPHITGLGAYLLALEGKKAPQDLCKYMQSISMVNALTDIPTGTSNYLAYNDNPAGLVDE